jgi:HTH-type transcriptional regulator/antitoxin HigA
VTGSTLRPAEVFSPGEYLKDELDERGWTVTEFAEIIGRPVQVVSEIINGKKEITVDTAVEFAHALGTSPELWLNLQTRFRLYEHRRRAATELSPIERRARLRRVIPLAEVKKRGWLTQTEDLDRLEQETCRLLEVNSVTDNSLFAIAAKRSNSAEPLSIEQQAWLGRVRAIARTRSVAQYDPEKLERLASELPGRLRSGPDLLPKLHGWMAECGVVFVFLEGLRGGKLDGAVMFLEDGRPVVALTGRGDRFDSFLFTLLHECAHLVLRHVTPDSVGIVDDDIAGGTSQADEEAANVRATLWLFPRGFRAPTRRVADIVAAAAEYGVHPSVVIGQIHRREGMWTLHRAHIPKVRTVLADDELEDS